MRPFHLLAVLLLGFTFPAAAQTTRCSPGVVPTTAPEIRFGVALLDAGQFAAESAAVRSGYQLWADWVNTEQGGINLAGVCHHTTLIFTPDSALLTTTTIETLIDGHGINFLFSPYAADLTHMTAGISERENILMLDSGGLDSALYERGFQHIFGLLNPAEAYTASGVEEAFRLGARTAIIAYTGDTYALAQGARDNLDRLGIRKLALEIMPRGSVQIMALFTRFREMNPDLFIAAGSSGDIRYWLNGARSMRFNVPAFLVAPGLAPAQLNEWGAYAEYIWGAAQWQPTLRYDDDYFGTAADYAARYTQAYGVAPGANAARATASAFALQLAIEAAGTLDMAVVRAALLDLDIETFYGHINFDERGLSVLPTVITTQVQMGELIPITPPNPAAVIWPMPTWEERTLWN